MKKHHEEIFELYEKDINDLLDEAGKYSSDIEQDILAEAWSMRDEDLRKLGIIYNAIKVKALSERVEYFSKELNLYEGALNFEAYKLAGRIKKELDFFVRHFLKDVPLKSLDYTPIPPGIRVQQINR